MCQLGACSRFARDGTSPVFVSAYTYFLGEHNLSTLPATFELKLKSVHNLYIFRIIDNSFFFLLVTYSRLSYGIIVGGIS